MIWFDFDNSPHVQIFKPILKKLESYGINYQITARDFAQTLDLLKLYGMKYQEIGRYGGKSKISKIFNLHTRSRELVNFIKGQEILKAVNHGSRTQVIAAKRLGIKSIVMMDYEYTENRIFNYFSDYILLPEVIPERRLKDAGFNLKKVVRYGGLKEEIYLEDFKPAERFRDILKVSNNDLLVVIRPPSMTSNYHNATSENILLKILKILIGNKNTFVLIIPRTRTDKDFIESKLKLTDNIRFLDIPVDGLQLLYAADITISGGGTMNRESALLGTKTYSIFTGKKPFVDEFLEQRGLISFLNDDKDVEHMDFQHYNKNKIINKSSNLVTKITDLIINLN
ncbi:MAG: DUF354 domain-containing protein [Candidatus Kapaibacterium sp.]